ncbi:MAG: hypothetical protein RL385_2736 [Pseudomonadota bacterium]|jgi:cysteine-rich repeat protein
MRDVVTQSAMAAMCLLSVRSVAHAACGDGHVDVSHEFCDDLNTASSDGCNENCETEAGYTCSGSPSTCCFRDVAAAYALRGMAHVDAKTNEVVLTEEKAVQVGLAWYRSPLDFTGPFSITQRIYLGSNDTTPKASSADSGGDGLSLLFQRDPRGITASGSPNGELGAYGIVPVVGVEFDTYDNGAPFADVTRGDEDHTALFRTRVNQNLVPATCLNASDTCANMEDGRYHLVTVSWTGMADHHLQVAFDGKTRIDYDGDLVGEDFAGDPRGIYFGFGASTGNSSNLQKICPSAPDGFRIPRDLDGDGIDDATDTDDDGDGRSDLEETLGLFGSDDPSDDHDHDGTPNYADVSYWTSTLDLPESCPDTYAPIGSCDTYPLSLDADQDGIPGFLQASPEKTGGSPVDEDGDGIPDGADIAPDNACWPVLDAPGCPTTDPSPPATCTGPSDTCPKKSNGGCSLSPHPHPAPFLPAALLLPLAILWATQRRSRRQATHERKRTKVHAHATHLRSARPRRRARVRGRFEPPPPQ